MSGVKAVDPGPLIPSWRQRYQRNGLRGFSHLPEWDRGIAPVGFRDPDPFSEQMAEQAIGGKRQPCRPALGV